MEKSNACAILKISIYSSSEILWWPGLWSFKKTVQRIAILFDFWLQKRKCYKLVMHVQLYIYIYYFFHFDCLKLVLFRMKLLGIDHVWTSFRKLPWNSTILVALILSYITLKQCLALNSITLVTLLNTVFPPRQSSTNSDIFMLFLLFPWNGRPWWARSLMQSLIFFYQRLCEFTLIKCSDNLI